MCETQKQIGISNTYGLCSYGVQLNAINIKGIPIFNTVDLFYSNIQNIYEVIDKCLHI